MSATGSRWTRLGGWMRAEDAPARLTWRMFWVGLIVRVVYMTLLHTWKMRPVDDHFDFGWEMGRIGRALATGYGFSDPFEGHTGPTAWVPPLYPLIIGAVFKVFGVYTKFSAWVLFSINSVFSAATAPAVYEIARRCFRKGTGTQANGRSIALWSGWLWALYPAAMQFAVHWIWDMALTAFLFTWALVLALRVRGVGEEDPDAERHQTTRRWAVFGVLWGLVALSNSSLLSFLPACGVWMIWPTLRQNLPRALRNAVLAAICCTAVMAPWVIRNFRVFHHFVPMRGNLGAELYQSVLPLNNGFPWGPTISTGVASPEYLRYKRLGEWEYSKEQGDRAKVIMHGHARRIYAYSVKRAYMFWFSVPHPGEQGFKSVIVEATRETNFAVLSLSALLGLALALWKRIPGAWLFLWLFLLYPLLLYLVTVQARFRHPLEPVMTVLIVYLFQSAELRKSNFMRKPANTSASVH